MFEPFGEITSAVVRKSEAAAESADASAEKQDENRKDSDASSKGFGFVNFADHESAKKAMEEMNGKKFMDGDQEKELYVRRLQTKKERQKELRDKHATVRHSFPCFSSPHLTSGYRNKMTDSSFLLFVNHNTDQEGTFD